MPDIHTTILPVEGVFNARDIGGRRNIHQRTLSLHRFVRSGHLNAITDAGVDTLAKWGVDCVIDLRSHDEVTRNPDNRVKAHGMDYHHIPLLDGIHSNAGGWTAALLPKSMEEMYIGFIEENGQKLQAVFSVLADPSYQCVLFHCTVGKDRTGTVAMLLLGLAGAPHKTIVKDYALSQDLMDMSGMNAAIAGFPPYLFASAPASMEATLAHLEQKYGGIDPYLTHIGVTEAQKRSIKDKLLPPRESAESN